MFSKFSNVRRKGEKSSHFHEKMSKLEEDILSGANSLVEWQLLLRSEAASPTPPSHQQSRPGSGSGLTARDFLKGFNVA